MKGSKKGKRAIIIGAVVLASLLIFVFVGYRKVTQINFNAAYTIGQPLDSLHGVKVYYNGGVGNVEGRALTADGYNLGLKYQCVEFVKRYYYEHYQHKMPDSYGHALSFFNPQIADGRVNTQRDLLQFTNGSTYPPAVGDLIVFDKTLTNPYGHVAIISRVDASHIEIIQQNPGPYGASRESISLVVKDGKHSIGNAKTLGWLRMR